MKPSLFLDKIKSPGFTLNVPPLIDWLCKDFHFVGPVREVVEECGLPGPNVALHDDREGPEIF